MPAVSVKSSVQSFWKLAPLIVMFWFALDAGTGLGNTLLMVGGPAVTLNGVVRWLLPVSLSVTPGLTALAVAPTW